VRYDCGTQAGFLEATVQVALARADVQQDFKHYLKTLSLD